MVGMLNAGILDLIGVTIGGTICAERTALVKAVVCFVILAR
jgi:hypothetical protein